MNGPSEEMKLASVKQNGYTIYYINNPSEELQLEAIKTINYLLPSIITSKKAIKKWHQIQQMKKACV